MLSIKFRMAERRNPSSGGPILWRLGMGPWIIFCVFCGNGRMREAPSIEGPPQELGNVKESKTSTA